MSGLVAAKEGTLCVSLAQLTFREREVECVFKSEKIHKKILLKIILK